MFACLQSINRWQVPHNAPHTQTDPQHKHLLAILADQYVGLRKVRSLGASVTFGYSALYDAESNTEAMHHRKRYGRMDGVILRWYQLSLYYRVFLGKSLT